MKIRSISILIMALLGGLTGILQARDIRTPLPFMAGPRPLEYLHYWRDNYCENCDRCDESLFDFYAWGAGLARSAPDGFGPCSNTSRVPLATIIFGKPSFTVAEAFANASVGSALPTNPFVSTALISPRFTYQESAALFGMSLSVQFGCENEWQAGVRIRVPFRDINMDLACDNDLIGEGGTLEEVFQTRMESIDFDPLAPPPPMSNLVYAARLDFLSALQQIALDASGNNDPLVEYINTAQGNQITIADEQVGKFTTSTEPFVAVLRNDTGVIPTASRWGDFPSAITGGIVGPDGSGVPQGGRGRFTDTPNFYGPLSTNVTQQRNLFVVPTIDPATNLIDQEAKNILDAIQSSIGEIESSVTSFLTANGVDFCDGRTKGVGDVDTEWYLGRTFCDCDLDLWGEVQLGIRFPSGKKVLDCTKVLKQPTGNNGHYEIRIGTAWGYKVNDWLRLNFDSFYSFVLRRAEAIAAPFVGATIKNLLGPCLCADISWGYYLGHFDVTFFASDCCGLSIGYEPYVKSSDKVWKSTDKITERLFDKLLANNISSDLICALAVKTTTDLLGRVEPIDAEVIERDTKRVAHKIRVEFFTSNNDACDIFGGWSQVVAGKNITQDTDWYIGFNVHF